MSQPDQEFQSRTLQLSGRKVWSQTLNQESVDMFTAELTTIRPVPLLYTVHLFCGLL